MGFEVVGTWVDDMDEPKKQIPKALIIGGLLMALFYILPATGFNIAIEANEDWIGAGGEIVVDVLNALFTNVGIGAGAVAYVVSKIRRRWYEQYLSNLDALSKAVLDRLNE